MDVEVELRGRPAPNAVRLGFDIFRADFRKAVAEAHGSTAFGEHAFDLESPELGQVLKGCRIVQSSIDEVTVMYLSSEPIR